MKKLISSCAIPALICSAACVDAADTTGAPIQPIAAPAPARGPALDLSLEAAQTALQACTAIQQKVAVTVLDSAGVVKVLLASDGASARGVLSSSSKAQTALTFRTATSALTESVKSDQQLAEKIAANSSFNIRAGGVLLIVNGEVVGAIGVGGARGSEKDEACALAGIAQIQSRLQ